MVIRAIRAVKIAVGSMQITVHTVQVPVGPHLGGRVMPGTVIGPIGGVEPAVGGMECPIRMVIPAVGRAGMLRLCGGCRQQDQQDGGSRPQGSCRHCAVSSCAVCVSVCRLGLQCRESARQDGSPPQGPESRGREAKQA